MPLVVVLVSVVFAVDVAPGSAVVPALDVVLVGSPVLVVPVAVVVAVPVIGADVVPGSVVPGSLALVPEPGPVDVPLADAPELLPPALVLPALSDLVGPRTQAVAHAHRHRIRRTSTGSRIPPP